MTCSVLRDFEFASTCKNKVDVVLSRPGEATIHTPDTDGELQRLALSASLMRASNLNVALRSARYGELSFVHSPTVTDLQLHGDYSLGTLVTDLAVNGSARFTVNHAENYVDGTVEGTFNTEAGAGLIYGASLQAGGTLDWHLGAGVGGDHYQSLQGRVQTDMMGGNVLASSHTGAEGGFYVGINAPKDEAWVIRNADLQAPAEARVRMAMGEVAPGALSLQSPETALEYTLELRQGIGEDAQVVRRDGLQLSSGQQQIIQPGSWDDLRPEALQIRELRIPQVRKPSVPTVRENNR